MRNYRALLLVIAALAVSVIVLLIMLFNPRHTPTTTTIVVSSSGLIGGTAKAGDILEFTTYQLIDPGYTVHFTGASPCSSKKTDLPVTPKQSASCTLVAPSGDEVSYLYVIKRNLSPGPHQQTVVPCKLCYFNNGSSAGSKVEQPQHAATAPSDNVTVSIGCAANGGNPGIYPEEADVLIDKVATVNWFPTGADFTVSFPNSPGSNPCTTNNFSNALPQCRIDPNAQTISYTYDWTLTCTGMPVTKGTGTVKLYADQAPK